MSTAVCKTLGMGREHRKKFKLEEKILFDFSLFMNRLITTDS
jgi:hypothetical protein